MRMVKMIKGKPFVKWAGGKRQTIDKLNQEKKLVMSNKQTNQFFV